MDVCVVLMTYGSPASLDDIPAYLRDVRGGREPDAALVAEFRRRYSLIGGSPLLQVTRAQAAALEGELRAREDGNSYRVVAGMRFAPPRIADVVREAAPAAGALVGVIMSPQFSPIIMGGYVRSFREAAESLGREGLSLRIVQDWHLQPLFLEALARRVTEALDRLPPGVRDETPVLLTAHSMPKRVVEGEPGYIRDLEETAAAVAELAGLGEGRWMFCYQSAGHTPEEWLKPDFADMMPRLRQGGYTHVVIAPVQFLADHLEILYDIDFGAREQAEKEGIYFSRTESLNTSPLFIRALASVVGEALGRSAGGDTSQL
ncbi:MAG: ferrochelatase [Nitrososphaerota archaeon]|nr:ferrochelatase [Nitrososphaerota archaeon]MDG6966560.1 ferrochelatase [Nitrososphaerota archaeon]MDG6978581.1 ferrochelatase [Nitrososphaerota archaeon]MDG7006302.1 ferrochelatase [Nitrososphaerota archaeon]MDG7020972.1 ferrochelatase [Nitrososphaerota archaeon]